MRFWIRMAQRLAEIALRMGKDLVKAGRNAGHLEEAWRWVLLGLCVVFLKIKY